jgi:hypothetical protein
MIQLENGLTHVDNIWQGYFAIGFYPAIVFSFFYTPLYERDRRTNLWRAIDTSATLTTEPYSDVSLYVLEKYKTLLE